MENTVVADFGIVHMFMGAHIVVKIVMVGLAAASVFTWTIVIEKFISLSSLRNSARSFETRFWSGISMEDLFESIKGERVNGLASIFKVAMSEWLRSQETLTRAGFDGVKERINKIMDIQMQREIERMQARLLFLATVGSSGPFIGLFGTVWGIMNSFRAIAVSKNTNLATVAPGLAEALFATALGLIAAIPAVIFYNMFSSEIGRLAARLANFADEFSAIVSRQIDKKA